MYICTRLIFKLRIRFSKFPSNTSPVQPVNPRCSYWGGGAATSQAQKCALERQILKKYQKSARALFCFFEDISPISVKSVKSLKSLYGADMMTGCRSKYNAVLVLSFLVERSSFQSRALNSRGIAATAQNTASHYKKE